MTQKTISIKDSLVFAATNYINHFGIILKLCLIWGLIFIIFGISTIGALSPFFLPLLQQWLQWYSTPTQVDWTRVIEYVQHITRQQWYTIGMISFLSYCLFILLVVYFSFQLLRLGLSFYDNKAPTPTIGQLFSFKDFGRYLGARLVYGLKVLFGTLLFIIPGVYFAYKYYFAGYSLVDGTHNSIGDDTRYNAQLTKSILWRLFLATAGIGFLIGLIAGRSGLQFTLLFIMPFFALQSVHLYKQLKDYEATQVPTS